MYDVLGIGANCIDYLSVVNHYPREDKKLEAEYIDVQCGGNIATACVAVSKMGGKPAFHEVVATTEGGNYILETLAQKGVDVSNVKRKKGEAPISFIIINKQNQSRTIIFSKRNVPVFTGKDVDALLIRDSKVLLVDFYHEDASLQAAKIARNMGKQVVIDAEQVTPLAGSIIKESTHLIASLDFARAYLKSNQDITEEQLVQKLKRKLSIPFVGITCGSKGAYYIMDSVSEVIHQPAFPVETVDTTGAGDVFHGVFAYFLASEYPIKEIMKISSAAAALTCLQPGGQKGIPTLQEVNEFIEHHK